MAVFLVILAHCGKISQAVPASLAPGIADLQLISWVGVDLFLVLSGFLVSGLLFVEYDTTGGIDIKRFLIRRAFKIIPPFYILMLFTVTHDWIFTGRINFFHFLHDIFFFQNYRLGSWGHTWTLALEVHFYILLGLLLYGLSRRKTVGTEWLRSLPKILLGVLLFCFLARLINSGLRHGNFNEHHELQPSHLHLDVLAAGVLLRYVYTYHFATLAIFQSAKAFWLGLGLLFIAPSEYLWFPHPALLTALIPTCNYLGFGFLLFETTQIYFPADGFWRQALLPFDYLGKHSYGIYLCHLPVKDWLMDPLMKDRGLLYFFSYLVTCLVVGTLFSLVLETPVLRLRNRVFPSFMARRTPAVTPSCLK